MKDYFVYNRQILDAVLIANEILEDNRNAEELMIFKIDVEKDYNYFVQESLRLLEVKICLKMEKMDLEMSNLLTDPSFQM